jgi:hypothetical protein
MVRVAHCPVCAIVRRMPNTGQLKWSALIGLASLACACQPEPQNEIVQNDTANESSPLPRLPLVEPPLDRGALLLAAAKAASAAALGQDDATDQRHLDGRRFEVRIRFGCAIAAQVPPSNDTPFNVQFDTEERTLRIRALPDLTLADPRVAALVRGSVEAVEGFWMRRPWLLSDGCPARPPQPQKDDGQEPDDSSAEEAATRTSAAVSSPQPRQRVGVARFYSPTDSRTVRREGRAYQVTKVLDANEQPSAQGYNLVLAGRLRELAAGRVISCAILSAEGPPDCVISAEFHRVWIETPDTKDVLAEWGS